MPTLAPRLPPQSGIAAPADDPGYVLRVLVADDRPVVRAGLGAVVAAEAGMELVGAVGDPLTAVAGCDPDVAVVGEAASPGLDVPGVIAQLRRDWPALRVLALAARDEPPHPLLAAGATGVARDRTPLAELARAIRAVAAGGTYLDPAPADAVGGIVGPAPDTAGGAALSDREEEVVRLVALGYSNKEIAARLKLSVKSVETYKTRATEKLGVRGRVQLVRHAAVRGWLAAEPPPGETAPD